jgi:hypothetical protein
LKKTHPDVKQLRLTDQEKKYIMEQVEQLECIYEAEPGNMMLGGKRRRSSETVDRPQNT